MNPAFTLFGRWIAPATLLLLLGGGAQATVVYENTSTTLGAGSISHMSAGSTEPRLDAQEVGDIVTLDPSTAPDRQLESIRIGYFNSGGAGPDTRFIADFIFRIYPVVENAGVQEIVDAPIFTKTFEDISWFDGAFAVSFDFDPTPTDTLILPETFGYTMALGTRADDPDRDGDGVDSNFSFNSRGPISTGSSPDGLVRRQGPPGQQGEFVTTVFGSGRQTRITINAGPITIPEPTTLALGGLAIVASSVAGRRR
ncbi:MAG: PEP-CTERM sorting domain-containing protein [Planctomycetota bacterium]